MAEKKLDERVTDLEENLTLYKLFSFMAIAVVLMIVSMTFLANNDVTLQVSAYSHKDYYFFNTTTIKGFGGQYAQATVFDHYDFEIGSVVHIEFDYWFFVYKVKSMEVLVE